MSSKQATVAVLLLLVMSTVLYIYFGLEKIKGMSIFKRTEKKLRSVISMNFLDSKPSLDVGGLNSTVPGTAEESVKQHNPGDWHSHFNHKPRHHVHPKPKHKVSKRIEKSIRNRVILQQLQVQHCRH